jgi:hypothetical protein
MRKEELNFEKSEQFRLTMIPGKFARRMRTCIPIQIFKFIIINLKMIIVVKKSH